MRGGEQLVRGDNFIVDDCHDSIDWPRTRARRRG